MQLTDDDVRAILRLLDASQFAGLDLETEEFRLSIQRADGGGWTRETVTHRAPGSAGGAADPASEASTGTVRGSAAAQSDGPSADARANDRAGLCEVRTPLPGTFYRSPQPGSAPFVEPGQYVAADSVVAIVETMKLMNSVLAGIGGRVVEICLADAEFAPQGAVLMRIRPGAS